MDMANGGRLFWDSGDHSSMILQNLGYQSSRISPGSSWQKCESNRKIEARGCVRERSGVLRGSRREWGHPGTVSGVVTAALSAPTPARPGLAQRTRRKPRAQPCLLFTLAAPVNPSERCPPNRGPPPFSKKSPLPLQQCCHENNILSLGHFTGFSGQVFSHAELFLRLKWQTGGKKTKSNLSLDNG